VLLAPGCALTWTTPGESARDAAIGRICDGDWTSKFLEVLAAQQKTHARRMIDMAGAFNCMEVRQLEVTMNSIVLAKVPAASEKGTVNAKLTGVVP